MMDAAPIESVDLPATHTEFNRRGDSKNTAVHDEDRLPSMSAHLHANSPLGSEIIAATIILSTVCPGSFQHRLNGLQRIPFVPLFT